MNHSGNCRSEKDRLSTNDLQGPSRCAMPEVGPRKEGACPRLASTCNSLENAPNPLAGQQPPGMSSGNN
eukprot:15451052-Alexandrium_andersonii.AAC.1